MMPRFAIDDAEKPAAKPSSAISAVGASFGGLLQTLKRGRPADHRTTPSSSPYRVCSSRDHGISNVEGLSTCSICGGDDSWDVLSADAERPEDTFDDFDLGPPPPSRPVLIRQNAVDVTAAAEAKLSSMVSSREVSAAVLTTVMPTRGGGAAAVVLPPVFIRQSLRRDS